MKRIRKDITLDPKIINWIEKKIKGGTYWNFSHCIESLVKEKTK